MGTADAGHNRAYLKHGNKWYCCEDSKLPEEKMPTDSPTEQNYCILLKKCPASSNSISVKPCQVENIPRQCQKPSLKHFISDESLQSNDEAKVDVQACRGCNKPFSRLLYHLKNSHACSKLYDMIALQKEMENAKKIKTKMRVNNFRQKQKDQDPESFKQKRSSEKREERITY